jgi:UDP-2,3-diacylglucosamine pyrophosphatase LpxH
VSGRAPDPPRPREWTAAFAADLHLSAGDRDGVARATALVDLCARRCRRLFLLGDLFDLWISGAELAMPEFAPLFTALKSAAAGGLALDFLAGNRDFNFTAADGAALGVRVATSEEIDVEIDASTDVGGGPLRLRLLHGDQLLRDDVAYQRMKRVVRSATVRFLARRMPRALTQSIGRRLRRYSDQVVGTKPAARLRIVPAAVRERFATGARAVLCGHVHRLARIDYGEGRELLVLPPFFESGAFVVVERGVLRAADLSGALHDLPPAGPIEGPALA